MPVFRGSVINTWITGNVIVTNDETKESKSCRVLRDPSWNLMSKEEWNVLKKEIDNFYKNIEGQEIIVVDEEKSNDVHKQESRKVKGYVYLVRADDGFVKIGRTIDIKNRFKTLSIQLPYKVSLLGVIKTDDYIGLEEELHCKYASKRVNGEWFKLDKNEIRELLKLVNI